jgi:hypothetical protein
MIGQPKIESIKTAEDIKYRFSSSRTDKMYRIACTFPALLLKGVERGAIPGIAPEGFDGDKLHEFLRHGRGRMWNIADVMILDFLLNLYDPSKYKSFNLGWALGLLYQKDMAACLNAAIRHYNAE